MNPTDCSVHYSSTKWESKKRGSSKKISEIYFKRFFKYEQRKARGDLLAPRSTKPHLVIW